MGSGLSFVHVSFGTSYFNAYSENGSLVMGNVFLNFFSFLVSSFKNCTGVYSVFLFYDFSFFFLSFFFHVFYV